MPPYTFQSPRCTQVNLGERSMPASDDVTHVLVNTELSMFGKQAYTTTRWDEIVNTNHIMPDYQPMEYLVAGAYMGELVRLILLEATETVGLFGGRMPSSLTSHYTLDARVLSAIETDTSPTLSSSRRLFQQQHPNAVSPAFSDMYFVQQVTLAVSRPFMCICHRWDSRPRISTSGHGSISPSRIQ